MASTQIGVVVGSLRRESLNRLLAQAIARMAPPDWRFEILQIGDLPPYDQDDDADPAPAVQRFKQQILDSRGIVFVTPEYNRSIPGVLKNAIDHASRPYGQSVWARKPVGIAGASIGAIGTACAQQHLRSIVSYLAMPLLPQPEVYLHAKPGFFDADGEIADAGSRGFVKTWVDAYVAWVEQHAPVRGGLGEDDVGPRRTSVSQTGPAAAVTCAAGVVPTDATVQAATTGARCRRTGAALTKSG